MNAHVSSGILSNLTLIYWPYWLYWPAGRHVLAMCNQMHMALFYSVHMYLRTYNLD